MSGSFHTAVNPLGFPAAEVFGMGQAVIHICVSRARTASSGAGRGWFSEKKLAKPTMTPLFSTVKVYGRLFGEFQLRLLQRRSIGMCRSMFAVEASSVWVI
ncbi:hypothetical protein A8144_06175 [Mycobacterium leprae 3125609]|nr:hypothetical protein A8144_06175 [Mycobacterium leprae 3125609]OAX71583.1 hypothetical protein A3216_04620 [Mycobacterium leprae 7935681]